MVAKSSNTTRVPISSLKPHPLNAQLFQVPSPEQIRALAVDIQERGLQHPIEILPDRTILGGHCRVEALKSLGHKHVDAIIRHDLAKEGERAIEQHMVSDNAMRRQLSPLERARCAVKLLESAVCKEREEDGYCDQDDDGRPEINVLRQPWLRERLRDSVGKMLNISGREVSRLVRVLEAPPEVQQAYDRKELSLDAAGKVVGLSEEEQTEIAEGIRSGEPAGDVVEYYVNHNIGRTKSVDQCYEKFLRDIQSGVAALADRIPDLKHHGNLAERNLEVLSDGAKLIGALTAREQASRSQESQ